MAFEISQIVLIPLILSTIGIIFGLPSVVSELRKYKIKKISIAATLIFALLFFLFEVFVMRPTERIFFDEHFYQDEAITIAKQFDARICSYGSQQYCSMLSYSHQGFSWSYTIALGYLITGVNYMTTAWNLNLMLATLSVVLIFFVTYLITKREIPAVLSAFFYATTPLILLWTRTGTAEISFGFYSLLALLGVLLLAENINQKASEMKDLKRPNKPNKTQETFGFKTFNLKNFKSFIKVLKVFSLKNFFKIFKIFKSAEKPAGFDSSKKLFIFAVSATVIAIQVKVESTAFLLTILLVLLLFTNVFSFSISYFGYFVIFPFEYIGLTRFAEFAKAKIAKVKAGISGVFGRILKAINVKLGRKKKKAKAAAAKAEGEKPWIKEAKLKKILIFTAAVVVMFTPALIHTFTQYRVDTFGAPQGKKFGWEYFKSNIYPNTKYWFNMAQTGTPRETQKVFNVFLTAFAFMSLALVPSKEERIKKGMLALAFWFFEYFLIYGFFYAGAVTYGADERFMVSCTLPMIILGSIGVSNLFYTKRLKTPLRFLASALIVGYVAYFFGVLLPYVTFDPMLIYEAHDARVYTMEFVPKFYEKIPQNCYVVTFVPGIFRALNRSIIYTDVLFMLNATGQIKDKCIYFDYGYWCVVPPFKDTLCKSVLEKFNNTLIASLPANDYETVALYKLNIPSNKETNQ